MRERMRSLTFEVICRAVFGVTEPARVERLRRALLALLDLGSSVFLPGVMQRDLGPWSPGGRLKRRLAVADALLYEEIELRRREPDLDERTDVLSLLLRARDEDGEPMSDAELRDELITLLAAGHETTATGLAFAFDLLLHNPAVLARLRDELDAGGDNYLNAVVTETLRLRPVIDADRAHADQAPHDRGLRAARRHPRVPGNRARPHARGPLSRRPSEFRPERFLDGKAESYSWLPFGGGIRRCIGAALAQAEMAEVIRNVVERLELSALTPETDPVVLRGITLAPARRHSGSRRAPASAPPASRRSRGGAVEPSSSRARRGRIAAGGLVSSSRR